MTGIAIRPARPSDKDAVTDLILDLNRFEDSLSGDRTTDRGSAARRYEEHLATLRRDDTAALVVAERDGGVVGYLFFLVEARPIFVRPELRRVGYVSELCVAPEARRAGVGKALLAEAERLARKHGAAVVGLTALVRNGEARAAYGAAGFEDYAIEMLKPVRAADE